MDFLEAIALVGLFVLVYIWAMCCGYVLDKLLRKWFNRGIFPKDYFKW